jgi:hypothetical protein
MADQTETMRLVAELQDKFSPQLKQMQRSLRSRILAAAASLAAIEAT